jgi:hypothetical protein
MALVRLLFSPGLVFVSFGLGTTACADKNESVGVLGTDAGADAENAAVVTHEVSLIDQAAWTYADVQRDPLASHQPSDIRCGLAGYHVERGELEMDTGSCNYIFIEQPALQAIEPGTEVRLSLRHFDLNAPEPALAHVAVLFGDSLQWETTIDVPNTANAYEVSWRSSEALATAEAIRIHLHNHGQNTWTLGWLTALLPEVP